MFGIHRKYIDENRVGFRPPASYMDACDRGMIILAIDCSEDETAVLEDIVGFLHYRRYVRGDKIRLYTMAIRDNLRGQGIGTLLINFLAECHGGTIVTEVRDTNIDSQEFFAKCGFVKDGIDERENYTIIKYFKRIGVKSMWFWDEKSKKIMRVNQLEF